MWALGLSRWVHGYARLYKNTASKKAFDWHVASYFVLKQTVAFLTRHQPLYRIH